ncbi:uncharacterized protein MYCGRDRAFT_92880 [Zymoseptoria tritici IPO323]|uniref:Uncharacterized protein n=1 Tax=Zymoseptoria tritici (strain CBS 115943 / IPO323) TaxID=336722 RepID=F9X981_ZYMTI|nr:uncharacterized protein MYCGRDRAFT_92880 [Zymoseptoria tritici IPO323]EGP88141.1 hypothetical protein MYCGRDRAFT_92880 [Zymoseptoria tritici IPO323]
MAHPAQNQLFTPPVVFVAVLPAGAIATDAVGMVARFQCMSSEESSKSVKFQAADEKIVTAVQNDGRSFIRWNSPSNGNRPAMVETRDAEMESLHGLAKQKLPKSNPSLEAVLPKMYAKDSTYADDLTWVIVFTPIQARRAFPHGYTDAGNLTILGVLAIFLPYKCGRDQILRSFHFGFCEAASGMLESLANGHDRFLTEAWEERNFNPVAGYGAATPWNAAGGNPNTSLTAESSSTSTSRSSSMTSDRNQADEPDDDGPKGDFPTEDTGNGNSTVVDDDTLEYIKASTKLAEKRAAKRAKIPAAGTGRNSSSSNFPPLSGASEPGPITSQSNDVVNAPKSVQVLRQITADLGKNNLTPADAPLQYQRRD